MKNNETPTPSTLRWFTGVPIITNPLMAVDIIFFAVLVWICGTVFVAAGQFLIGDGLSHPALIASAAYAGYVAGAIVAVFLFVGVLLGNKYAALYKMDARTAYCETMRGAVRGEKSAFFRRKPYPIDPLLSPTKSRAKTVAWADVRGILPIPSLRTVILKGNRGGTILKVYCPDDETFAAAVRFIIERLNAKTA